MTSWKSEFTELEKKYHALLDDIKNSEVECPHEHVSQFGVDTVIPSHGVAVKFVNKTRPYYLSSQSSFGFEKGLDEQVANIVGEEDTLDQEVIDE